MAIATEQQQRSIRVLVDGGDPDEPRAPEVLRVVRETVGAGV